jgi:hypothetical protein
MDKSTLVTISGPVSLPGVTLPAGTYLFRLADTQASRNVVQVFDRDRTKIYATLIAISALRDEASDEAVVTFKETPADRPPAVRYWYYAGEKSGQEFAYPREQAMRIASASGESVMAIDSTSSDLEAMKSAEMSRIEANAANAASAAQAPKPAAAPAEPPAQAPVQPEPAAQTPASTPAPTPAQAEPQPAVQPEAQAPPAAPRQEAPRTTAEPQPTGTSGELPRTASELPLMLLIGVLAISGAFAVHAVRRRVTL